MRHKLMISTLLIATSTLSACGTAGGLVASDVAGSVATGAVANGPNKARFSRMDCNQLAAEIAGAKRQMINPMAIPSTQAYIRDAQEVAAAKGCNLA